MLLCETETHFELFFFCRSLLNQGSHAAQNYGAPSSPTSTMAPQSGRGASVVSDSLLHLTDLITFFFV